MTRSLTHATALAVCLAACARDTTLPPPPVPPTVPAISAFAPHAAFSQERVVVWGEHFAPSGNRLTFAGGLTALAEAGDDGDLRVDGGVVFLVPEGDVSAGPLVLSNTQGSSEPSADEFSPLGVGHPNFGTPVSTLRFRHDPVGLIDSVDNVLLASSIFDVLVTDDRKVQGLPGRPLALEAGATPGRPFVSVRTARGGAFFQVEGTTGELLLSSEEGDTRELFILPPTPSAPGTLARTIGRDLAGRTWLSEWREDLGTRRFAVARRQLPLLEVVGATAEGDVVFVAGRSANPLHPAGTLYRVTSGGVELAWAPRADATCVSTDATCAPLDGPMALVPRPALADGGVPAPTLAASLATGDLLLVPLAPGPDAGVPEPAIVRLSSYAPIEDLAPGLAPGRLLLTKAQDGALFQYDLEREEPEVEWSVQLRGEPSVIHVAADIDEVAVGNRADNSVDIITASTGTWAGRIAFDLGLGAASGREGGIVAPYSYDPARYPPGAVVKERMDLLLRHTGLVASIDASSLDVFAQVVLESDEVEIGAPLRLFVTSELETLVLHEKAVGLLEATGAGFERKERILTTAPLDRALDLAQLDSGELVVSTQGAVQVFRWVGSGAGRKLALAHELPLPGGASWVTTVPAGDRVLIAWRSASSGLAGGFFDAATLGAGATARTPLSLGAVSDYVGSAALASGPALFFGQRGGQGPAAFTSASLIEGLDPLASPMARPRLAGLSPDRRYLAWLDEGAEEPIARLVRAPEAEGEEFFVYSSYRLSGPAAGPAFDPSGEWFYLPVPRLDELVVVE